MNRFEIWADEHWGRMLIALFALVVAVIISAAALDPGRHRPSVEARHYPDGTVCYIKHNRGIAGASISCVRAPE